MARISKTQLIKLQKKFKTDAAIGKQFGITRQAIHQLRKKYGIDSSLATNPKRNEELIRLYDKGASGTSLAKKFNLSISQTYRIINESKTPVKKAAKKSVKKAVKTPAKKTVKKPVKKVVKKAVKTPAKKTVKKPAKKVVKKAVKTPAKKAVKKPVKKVVKKAVKKSVKKTAKKRK